VNQPTGQGLLPVFGLVKGWIFDGHQVAMTWCGTDGL
jgi:hypothetical protein